MKIEDINKISKIAIEAGKTILEIYNSGNFEIETKNDNSPLTLADSRSNEIINSGLGSCLIDEKVLPVLSEEGRNIPYKERRGWSKFWLVDPLDGTKEFIKQNGEFTVNIALIENGIPVAGFVYIPVHDIMYFAAKDLGSYKLANASGSKDPKILKMSEKLTGRVLNTNAVKVVASRSHMNVETGKYITTLKEKYDKVITVSSGSSIKLCMVAEGSADVYPRFAPTMEWDTAAAHAVCRYAGVRVTNYKTKKELKYNKPNLLNDWFLVSGNKEFEEF